MEKHDIKYVDEIICFQEVPSEVSLSFSISNCIHNCDGCHSKYLCSDTGKELEPVLEEKLKYYFGLATCILFMGGDDKFQIESLIRCIELCKKYNFKTALYSGNTQVDDRLKVLLDYIKIGPFIKELGGLNSPTTNQKMYKKTDYGWEDITFMFAKKKKLYDDSFMK